MQRSRMSAHALPTHPALTPAQPMPDGKRAGDLPNGSLHDRVSNSSKAGGDWCST